MFQLLLFQLLWLFIRISLQRPFVQCNKWSGLGGSETIIALDGIIGGEVVEEIGGTYWTAATAVAVDVLTVVSGRGIVDCSIIIIIIISSVG